MLWEIAKKVEGSSSSVLAIIGQKGGQNMVVISLSSFSVTEAGLRRIFVGTLILPPAISAILLKILMFDIFGRKVEDYLLDSSRFG